MNAARSSVFVLPLVLLSTQLAGQATNTFPTSGNAGVGTTSPGSRKLNVQSPDSTNDVGLEVSLGRSIGTNYGILVNTHGSGAGLNQGIFTTAGGGDSNFGLRIHNVAGAPANYALFSDSAAQSYFQGNVGIGTTTPGAGLHVATPAVTRLAQLGSAIVFTSTNDTQSWMSSSKWGWTGSAWDRTAGSNAVMWGTGNNIGSFEVWTASSSAAASTAPSSSNSRLIVTNAGNVGIGTVAPSARLNVAGGHVTIDAVAANNQDLLIANAGGRTVEIVTDAQGDGQILLRDSTGTVSQVSITAGGNSFLNGGNVGIGTSSPSHKLAVNGTIRAKEVIVDTGWADYVFADDYRLSPLNEVAEHIRAHKRLPGIPSAARVAEEGLSMGEMQALMMAKIEELTLHAIEQSRRIDRLENENRVLRAEYSQGAK